MASSSERSKPAGAIAPSEQGLLQPFLRTLGSLEPKTGSLEPRRHGIMVTFFNKGRGEHGSSIEGETQTKDGNDYDKKVK